MSATEEVKKSWRNQSWLTWAEHAIVAGSLYYFGKKVYDQGLKNSIEAAAIGALQSIPGGDSILKAEQAKVVEQIRKFAVPDDDGEKFREIPKEGVDREKLYALLQSWRDKEQDYRTGRAFGGIYTDDHSHEEFINRVYCLYADSNALYPGVFPGLRKFEAEVVRMAIGMLQGGEEHCGAMTSGGTESIFLAIKQYREWARKHRPNVRRPNIVVPQSAHAAFPKAAYYLDLEFRMVPVPENSTDYRVRVEDMAAAIDSNTIALVASAPQFPQGVIDPIEELGALAAQHGIGLHVDCCLGGFVLPWLRKLGHVQRGFDFSVEGVTSVSADLHKYGMGPKGSSVVLYNSRERLKLQFYKYTEWSGGIYCTSSAAGSRPGGVIAGAWATLMSLGESGYLEYARRIHDAHQRMVEGLSRIPHIRVLGPPDACVVAFVSDDPKVDIYKLADALIKCNQWQPNRLQKPRCLQFQIGARANFDVDLFLADVQRCMELVRTNPDDYNDGLAAVYTTAAEMPNRGMVADLMEEYLSALLEA